MFKREIQSRYFTLIPRVESPFIGDIKVSPCFGSVSSLADGLSTTVVLCFEFGSTAQAALELRFQRKPNYRLGIYPTLFCFSCRTPSTLVKAHCMFFKIKLLKLPIYSTHVIKYPQSFTAYIYATPRYQIADHLPSHTFQNIAPTLFHFGDLFRMIKSPCNTKGPS